MTKTKRRFFRLASVASEASEYPKLHIGAAIVSKRQVVALGTNRWRTHPKQKKYTQYRYDDVKDAATDAGRIHAEMDALIKAGRADLNGASIFVYREDLNGKIADSKPCGACMRAIKDRGIKHVYYTSRDGYNHLEIL